MSHRIRFASCRRHSMSLHPVPYLHCARSLRILCPVLVSPSYSHSLKQATFHVAAGWSETGLCFCEFISHECIFMHECLHIFASASSPTLHFAHIHCKAVHAHVWNHVKKEMEMDGAVCQLLFLPAKS